MPAAERRSVTPQERGNLYVARSSTPSGAPSRTCRGVAINRRAGVLAAITVVVACSAALAAYSVSDRGIWPETWPKELEPLRKQAHTYEGPTLANRHYLIPFTNRAEFEAAWPHLLEVKGEGAPIILVRGPKTDFMKIEPAGVLIHTPPIGSKEAQPATPLPGQTNPRVAWMKTSFIELVVDGDIVDLNRIALPPDTPIIDERFKIQERE